VALHVEVLEDRAKPLLEFVVALKDLVFVPGEVDSCEDWQGDEHDSNDDAEDQAEDSSSVRLWRLWIVQHLQVEHEGHAKDDVHFV